MLQRLEALRLALAHILKHGGIHLVRHLRHILPQKHRLHNDTVLSPAV